jgi:transposase
MTRMKLLLARDRVRLQNQMESLLEEMRIKLSIVVSNLLGTSGFRILRALAKGETDPKQLAQLGDERLQCTQEQLVDALTGRAQPMHREMLALQLERLQLIDTQIAQLNGLIAQAMKPASRGRDPIGGSAGTGSRFGAASDRGSGRASQHLPLGGRIDLLGGNLSRQGGKRRGEPQQVVPPKAINICGGC